MATAWGAPRWSLSRLRRPGTEADVAAHHVGRDIGDRTVGRERVRPEQGNRVVGADGGLDRDDAARLVDDRPVRGKVLELPGTASTILSGRRATKLRWVKRRWKPMVTPCATTK
jgi:hypothetical protein